MAYYQLENGYVYTAKQYKRLWPGGKVPSPAARRILGIKTITKKQYDAAKRRGNPGPSQTSYGVDPNAITRKMTPYRPAKKPKRSTAKTHQVRKSNPAKHRRGSLTWARSIVKQKIKEGARCEFIIGHYTTGGMPRYEVKIGARWKKTVVQPSEVHFWYPEEVWVGEPKKSGKGLKAVKVESQIRKPFGRNPGKSDHKQAMLHAEVLMEMGFGTPAQCLKKAAQLYKIKDAKALVRYAKTHGNPRIVTGSATQKGRQAAAIMDRASWQQEMGRKSWGRKNKAQKTKTMKNPPPLPSTVIPAYGRDYTTKAQAVQSWEDGKDWIIADHFSPWDGKPISIRDFPMGSSVNLRYAKLRKVTRYTHGSSGAQRMKKSAPRKTYDQKIKTMSLPELEDEMASVRASLVKQKPGTPKQKELLHKYHKVLLQMDAKMR